MGKWPDKQWKVVVCLALALGTAVVYWPALQYGFTEYDDPQYVSENPMVGQGLTLHGVRWAFTTFHAANWHPLTWLSHMLDVQLFGMHPGAHHGVNLLFHIANSLLLFLVLGRMTRAQWPSALVAALFAWHPLHVESAAWIAERKDVLSTFFALLTLRAYAGYTEAGRRVQLRLALLWFALGLMAKPMLVTLPLVLLLLDYWPLKRFAGNGRSENEVRRRSKFERVQPATPARVPSWSSLAPLLREKALFFVLTALACVVTFVAQQRGGSVISLETVSLWDRLSNAFGAYAGYLYHTVWPTKLAVFYPHSGALPLVQVVLALLVLMGVSVAAVRWAGHRPWLLMGWLWYLGTLVPVIGLVQVGPQAMADRYTYLPLVGVFVATAWGLAEAAETFRLRPIVRVAVAGAVLLVLLLVTAAQVRFWASNESLFRHAIAVTSRNYLAHFNLGVGLVNQKRPAEAVEQFAESLRVYPKPPAVIHFTYGALLAKQGKFKEAAEQYELSLRLKSSSTTHYNLGNALIKLGRFEEATAHLAEAARLEPGLAEVHGNWGFTLAAAGRFREALEHYNEALRLKSGLLDVHYNAAEAHRALGQFDEAARHYGEALAINPNLAQAQRGQGWLLALKGNLPQAASQLEAVLLQNPTDADAHYFLGVTLAAQQKMDGALLHLEEVMRLRPDWPPAFNTAARLLSTHENSQWRNGPKAVQLAERACALANRSIPRYEDTLAAAYAEAGRFGEAAATAQTAIFLAAGTDQTALAAAIRQRSVLYQLQRPCREKVDPANY
jgi:tetratricopeptide (TPR) repeat protein